MVADIGIGFGPRVGPGRFGVRTDAELDLSIVNLQSSVGYAKDPATGLQTAVVTVTWDPPGAGEDLGQRTANKVVEYWISQPQTALDIPVSNSTPDPDAPGTPSAPGPTLPGPTPEPDPEPPPPATSDGTGTVEEPAPAPSPVLNEDGNPVVDGGPVVDGDLYRPPNADELANMPIVWTTERKVTIREGAFLAGALLSHLAIRVRARTGAGVYGPYTYAVVETAKDTTPPPTPAGVGGRPLVKAVAFSWDGTFLDGAPRPPDLAYVALEVLIGTEWVRMGQLLEAGELVVGTRTALTVTGRFISVDLVGNVQTVPSAEVTLAPGQVEEIDIADLSLTVRKFNTVQHLIY